MICVKHIFTKIMLDIYLLRLICPIMSNKEYVNQFLVLDLAYEQRYYKHKKKKRHNLSDLH